MSVKNRFNVFYTLLAVCNFIPFERGMLVNIKTKKMNTITLLKQKIDYWNEKFNEETDLKTKGLINLHLRDLEDILTNVKKEFAEL